MASIKLQSVSGPHIGDVSCDWRGDKFKGEAEGDHHKTLFEKDFGSGVETNEFIERVLRLGPEFNRIAAEMFVGWDMPKGLGQLFNFFGVGDRIRIVVMDN